METGCFYFIAIKDGDAFKIAMKEEKPNNMTKKEAEEFVADTLKKGTAEDDILFLRHSNVEVKITVSCDDD